MSFIRGFLYFWYDFLVGDAWDIAAGVVVALLVLWVVVQALPAASMWLGPFLALAVIILTWASVQREVRRR